jgi:oxygen-dependent protoporphyrinogen oxidase
MRILVVGGGITGLAAAHRLVELARERSLDLDVRLLEAEERVGGAVSTLRRDGFVLENGPDSMITDKPWGLDLARRLGLHDWLIGTQPTHRRSFVARGGKLLPVPEGFQLLAPSRFAPLAASPIFSWAGKLRMAMDLLIPPRRDEGDESLGAFVLRRLGREALERMAQPMVAGIYGADPMQLSLQATLPRFLEMERRHGSVIRGMWARSRTGDGRRGTGDPGPTEVTERRGGCDTPTQASTPHSALRTPHSGVSGARYGLFVSFREGMQTLPDALAERLPPGCLCLNTRVESLAREGERWLATLSDGQALAADAVVLALPAYRSAALLQERDAELARLLAEIPYASCATLSLCYPREEVPHPLDGFGFVVPSVEGLTLLGCTFSHVKWAHRAPEGVALLRAFLGHDAAEKYDDGELARRVRRDLERLLGVSAEPRFTHLWRGSRVMPQYRVGHLERVAEIERRTAALPGMALAGNAFRGVGIPDCVHSGETAAEALLASLVPA